MNNISINNREELLSVFKEIAQDFNGVAKKIDVHEKTIKDALEKVKLSVLKDPLETSYLPKEHPFRLTANEMYIEVKEQLLDWIKTIETYDKGTNFKKEFGDSLLIFVYGKVKAGKSSLGNYLAYGNPDPTPKDIAQEKIKIPSLEYFWRDGTGKNEQMSKEKMATQQCFGVGHLETTSSIQGFKIPGLTWIDSPGLGSMNKENGALATEYITNADLVVFTTQSTSPGRKSDLDGIKDLLTKNKPLAVLITKCDEYFEDEINNEIIQSFRMKSKKDQDDQKNYVNDELLKLPVELQKNLLNKQVFPLSVRYACKYNDSHGWGESGLDVFSKKIGAIAKADSIKIKQNTPLNNLKSFCKLFVVKSNDLKIKTNDLQNSLQEGRERLKKLQANSQLLIKTSVRRQIEDLAEHCISNKDNQAFIQGCRFIQSEQLTKASEIILQEMGNIFQSIQRQTEQLDNLDDLPGFEDKHQRRSYKKSSNRGLFSSLRRGLGDIVSGIGLETIGGWIKPDFKSNSGSVSIKVGDNSQDIARLAYEKIVTQSELHIKQWCESLDQQCFESIAVWIESVSDVLEVLNAVLNNQVINIDQEINK